MPPKKQPLQPLDTVVNILPTTTTTTAIENPPKKPTGKSIEEMYQKKTQLEHILLRPDTYIGSIENPPKKPTGKSIEEMYQKKTQLEHILLRPDTYIGSIEKHDQTLWIYTPDSEMVQKQIKFVPGLYKIFDEILVNAADNKQRDPKMDRVEVDINQEENMISVYNTGDGIPVEVHKEEGVYVPELIFGHLLTSSNYNDDEKKTTGGRNGYGAKLTNIFSTFFVIETADGNRQLKYKQVFHDNMSRKGNPEIKKCKPTENWTKVTFKPDLAKFNMTELEDDVVALMKKRVVDLAGCLAASYGKKVKVFLNGKEIVAKSFYDYAQLYLDTAAKNKESPLPRFDNNEKLDLNRRWQISVSVSDGQFQQVSFVNGINTTKGGTHVDYITGQITKSVIEAVKKKKKSASLKPHIVKNYLWVFVNALIDNPAFDSQTKETLTTRVSSFGSTCELSDKFLKKVVYESGVVDSILSWADYKEKKDMKKTDGTKTRRLHDVPKLEDANQAGGSRSHECTLILTEGDSAKALAMAGLAVVGRNYYGVFPLRGKLLNVRDANHKQITDNAEINYIKKILGLKQGEKYDKADSVKSLRYGHLMIMADQDHDGSHIKGLVINFIHTFWPSLLRNPSFMLSFITPIVKATRGEDPNKEVISFYSMPEYEDWFKSQGSNAKKWTIKYYKGLGTSDGNEGKEYFSNLARHRKIFSWKDDSDGNAIELAFSKKKIEARKDWLREAETGSILDHKEEIVRYSDFVHKELKLFSRADLQRSIPSMVDGFKPTQRKVLFAAFKKNLVKEMKVSQFGGFVSEKSAYHHGDASIQSTIVGMAQNFVGSNNVNLLRPSGQFGTRNMGGKDVAGSRYISTQLTDVARFLFHKEDDRLLNYLNEDGLSIEPNWYMPIIPTVLVNGSEGIGTGWSTFIPNYNPRDIIANIRHLLNDEPLVPMDPWYNKFKGTIEKKDATSYVATGIIEEIESGEENDEVTLKISELPVRKWTQDYKGFLASLTCPTDKKEAFIKDFYDHSTDETASFDIILSKKNYNVAKQEGLTKKFNLTTALSTKNMHLFDQNGKIVKYESPEEILEKFFHLRLVYYTKRKEKMMEIFEAAKVKFDNQVRFILGVVEGEIVVSKKKKAVLVNELRERGFTPIPKNKTTQSSEEKDDDSESSNEQDEAIEIPSSNAPLLSDYDYLLSMAIASLTIEKVKELQANREKTIEKIEQLKKETERSLWEKDLVALEMALAEKDRKEEEAAKNCREKVEASAQKGKKTRKTTKNVTTKTKTEQPAGNGVKVKKGRPAKKEKASVQETSEDIDIPGLRERLAAYHLDSSPDKSEMETDSLKADAKKLAAEIEISDGDDDNEDESFEPTKRGRGRQPSRPDPNAGTKKRGPASKKLQPSQKLITDSFKASEVTETSPDKKVRRMRPSPFNKKSGSVLDNPSSSAENVDISSFSLDSIDEVPAARARPQRANKKQMTYVVSSDDDDDDDGVQELASDDDSSDVDISEDDDDSYSD